MGMMIASLWQRLAVLHPEIALQAGAVHVHTSMGCSKEYQYQVLCVIQPKFWKLSVFNSGQVPMSISCRIIHALPNGDQLWN